MLMCENGDGIHIKIGLADNPIQRLRGLITGCPLVPGLLSYVELPSRLKALNFEQELHCALEQWRRFGEWFLFQYSDKSEFNRIIQDTAKHFASPSWPIAWKKLDLLPIFAKLSNTSVVIRSGGRNPLKRHCGRVRGDWTQLLVSRSRKNSRFYR